MPAETAAEIESTPQCGIYNQTFLILRLTSSGGSKRSILESCRVTATTTVTRGHVLIRSLASTAYTTGLVYVHVINFTMWF